MTVVNFVCSPEEAKDDSFLEKRIREELSLSSSNFIDFRWRKRSIDARQKNIKINASFEVGIDEALAPRYTSENFKTLQAHAPVVHIVGAGPAGLFAHFKQLHLASDPSYLNAAKMSGRADETSPN